MSFDDIYAQNYRSVYLLAYRIVRDEDVSKDIAQEVFIKLHNFLSGGNKECCDEAENKGAGSSEPLRLRNELP